MTAVSAKPHPSIPRVREWPLLGSVPAMAKDPAAHFYRCYRAHGPIFQMNMLGKPYAVLAGPEAANFMGSKAGKDSLRSREFWHGLSREYGSTTSLPGADGDQHKELRDILRRGYSKESIKGRYDRLIEITDQSIERDWPLQQSIPVVFAMQLMVTDQLGAMITGDAPLEYVEDIRVFIWHVLNCLVTRQRPEFLLRFGGYQRARSRLFELADQIRRDYENGKRAGGDARTIVDDVMQAYAAGSAAMPEQNLRMHLTAPYVAGLDTVANTLGFCVYTILKHPETYARILDEVDGFFAAGTVEEQGLLKKLPLLNGAIMETMRLYPIAAAGMRTANKDFEFEGHPIFEGQTLYMGTSVPHFMHEFYPDPQRFDIHRFDPDRAEHKKPGAYSPYGRGPHTCLGKSLAEIQLLLSMARLLYKRELALPSADYQLKTKTAPTPGPGNRFAVKVQHLRC